MKKLFALLSLLLAGFSAQAQYMKMDIWELAGTADLVLYGKISQAQQGLPKVTLEITEVIAGTFAEGTIDLDKFINTKFAKRWGKYIEGEMVVVFLKEADGKYKIMGKGGEGEKLVMGEDIYLDGRGGAVFNKFTYYPLLTTGQIYAEKVLLEDFKTAVKGYKKCFEIVYKEEVVKDFEEMQMVAYTKQICGDIGLDEYRNNDISAKLIDLSIEKKAE